MISVNILGNPDYLAVVTASAVLFLDSIRPKPLLQCHAIEADLNNAPSGVQFEAFPLPQGDAGPHQSRMFQGSSSLVTHLHPPFVFSCAPKRSTKFGICSFSAFGAGRILCEIPGATCPFCERFSPFLSTFCLGLPVSFVIFPSWRAVVPRCFLSAAGGRYITRTLAPRTGVFTHVPAICHDSAPNRLLGCHIAEMIFICTLHDWFRFLSPFYARSLGFSLSVR